MCSPARLIVLPRKLLAVAKPLGTPLLRKSQPTLPNTLLKLLLVIVLNLVMGQVLMLIHEYDLLRITLSKPFHLALVSVSGTLLPPKVEHQLRGIMNRSSTPTPSSRCSWVEQSESTKEVGCTRRLFT